MALLTEPKHRILYLSESFVQIKLPPVELVGIEREIIVFPTVAGVGQNVAATFGESKKNMSRTRKGLT